MYNPKPVDPEPSPENLKGRKARSVKNIFTEYELRVMKREELEEIAHKLGVYTNELTTSELIESILNRQ